MPQFLVTLREVLYHTAIVEAPDEATVMALPTTHADAVAVFCVEAEHPVTVQTVGVMWVRPHDAVEPFPDFDLTP